MGSSYLGGVHSLCVSSCSIVEISVSYVVTKDGDNYEINILKNISDFSNLLSQEV